MDILLDLRVTLYIPLPEGQHRKEFFRRILSSSVFLAQKQWTAETRASFLMASFAISFQRHRLFLKSKGTDITSALVTIWQQSHLPVGITEDGHDLIHDGRISDVTVRYQHFINLTGCGFPDLWARAEEASVRYAGALSGTAQCLHCFLMFTVTFCTVLTCLWQWSAARRDWISAPQGNSYYYMTGCGHAVSVLALNSCSGPE